MQDVIKSEPMESIAFIVLCGAKSSRKSLSFCLERLSKLERSDTNITEIYVYLVCISSDANYIRGPKFKEQIKTFENIKVEVVLGATNYATEPRAYNLGLDAALDGPADYIVFMHETDVITDKRLLDYYMWLFASAHNTDLIGAVNLSSNANSKKVPDKVKMWYGDDLFLRGACFRRRAIKNTGPFDESILYRYFEWDYFSKMTHHAGWLVRIGKEENRFIKFGGPNLTPDHHKLSITNKQSLVWFARKWHHKGIWPEEKGDINCYIRVNTFYTESTAVSKFLDKFILSANDREARQQRFEILYGDKAIKYAIKLSDSFKKEPLGHYTVRMHPEGKPLVKNNPGIQTHIKSDIKYWNDMLWDVKGVY